MALLTPGDRVRARAIAGLAYCNPFLPERIAFEKATLGPAYTEVPPWNLGPDYYENDPNVAAMRALARTLADEALERLKLPRERGRASRADLALYEDVVLFLLYSRYTQNLEGLIAAETAGGSGAEPVEFHDAWHREAAHYFDIPDVDLRTPKELAHVFACFYQIRRAFHHIFYFIVGTSRPAARLRAAVWQSIFTHDIRRYRTTLYNRMADFTTLITGPSGTGKELVARAIGFARYIPFTSRTHTFKSGFLGSFHELNLSALSPTLIESELFGHRRGAFTGALADRKGWLEVCPPLGTAFLDEIGEIDPAIQVKLLRVLQSRTFQRLGETRLRRFEGKIMAATHRDVEAAMHAGRLREDFYYRICSDVIEVPSLADRIRDEPSELTHLIRHLVARDLGEDSNDLASEVEAWIDQHLGRDYGWPGNVRELEQCLRNVMIRRAYHPPRVTPGGGPSRELADAVAAGSLTVAELLSRYTTLVYSRSGSYEETARRLGVDRRTVKSRIDREWLEGAGTS